MTEKEFNLLFAIKKHGVLRCRETQEFSGAPADVVAETLKQCKAKGFVGDTGITDGGLAALEPYKVDNAVIMAAGTSSRFVPLSLEKPKGLLTVRGEILIERQIEQLRGAGIPEIVLVLGYRKEAFFYLEKKYPGLKFVINPEYDTKNNTHSLYLARRFIRNSFICSSDDYFEINPFEDYVFRSYYAAIHVSEKTDEWYMIPDAQGNIARVEMGREEGDIMLGHVYWDRVFSKAMLRMLKDDFAVGRYGQKLWEQILADHTQSLPPMAIRVYPEGAIFEFDSLDELRPFDHTYIDHSNSVILEKIAGRLGCREGEIHGFKAVETSRDAASFTFEAAGKRYLYRHFTADDGAADEFHSCPLP